MSERVYLPTKGAKGLDMPSGEKYDEAYPGAGYVEVNDLHAAVLKGYAQGLTVGQRHFSADAPDIECAKCGFNQFKALAGPRCSKCGAARE